MPSGQKRKHQHVSDSDTDSDVPENRSPDRALAKKKLTFSETVQYKILKDIVYNSSDDSTSEEAHKDERRKEREEKKALRRKTMDRHKKKKKKKLETEHWTVDRMRYLKAREAAEKVTRRNKRRANRRQLRELDIEEREEHFMMTGLQVEEGAEFSPISDDEAELQSEEFPPGADAQVEEVVKKRCEGKERAREKDFKKNLAKRRIRAERRQGTRASHCVLQALFAGQGPTVSPHTHSTGSLTDYIQPTGAESTPAFGSVQRASANAQHSIPASDHIGVDYASSMPPLMPIPSSASTGLPTPIEVPGSAMPLANPLHPSFPIPPMQTSARPPRLRRSNAFRFENTSAQNLPVVTIASSHPPPTWQPPSLRRSNAFGFESTSAQNLPVVTIASSHPPPTWQPPSLRRSNAFGFENTSAQNLPVVTIASSHPPSLQQHGAFQFGVAGHSLQGPQSLASSLPEPPMAPFPHDRPTLRREDAFGYENTSSFRQFQSASSQSAAPQSAGNLSSQVTSLRMRADYAYKNDSDEHDSDSDSDSDEED